VDALGFGLGLENVQKALALMLAQRQQNQQDQLAEGRFNSQMGLERDRMAQEGSNAAAQRGLQQQGIDLQARGITNAQTQNEWERGQAELHRSDIANAAAAVPAQYRAFITAGLPIVETPEQRQAREMALAAANNLSDEKRTNATTAATLQAARIAAGAATSGRPTEEDRFRDDLNNQIRNLGSQGMDFKDMGPSLRTWMSLSQAFKFDPQKTHNFISPGVDPFVRSRFGGDYSKATSALQTDPMLYKQLASQGVDPDQVAAAVIAAQRDYAAKADAQKRAGLAAALAKARGTQNALGPRY
jgi:hypothetical protein